MLATMLVMSAAIPPKEWYGALKEDNVRAKNYIPPPDYRTHCKVFITTQGGMDCISAPLLSPSVATPSLSVATPSLSDR